MDELSVNKENLQGSIDRLDASLSIWPPFSREQAKKMSDAIPSTDTGSSAQALRDYTEEFSPLVDALDNLIISTSSFLTAVKDNFAAADGA